MKNLSTITIAFFLLTGVLRAQYQDLPQKNGSFKFKNDIDEFGQFINRSTGDQIKRSVTDSFKSTPADYGNPPDWNWTSQFGGSGEDIARDIIADNDGGIYVTGSFSGEISITATDIYTSVGRRDAFIAKFQDSGQLIWFAQLSPSTEQFFDSYGINMDNSGNLYITGYYTGSVNIGGFNLPDLNEKNLFFAKLNSDGEILLAQNHTTGQNLEAGLVIDTDESGNIYILGSTDGTTNRYHPSVIIKYSPDGTLIFDFTHDQSFNDMQVFGQKIYFTGTIYSPDYFGDIYLEPIGYGEVFIAKSDLEVEFEWANMAGHTNYGNSYGYGLYLSQNEDVFFTGHFRTDIILGQHELTGDDGFVAKCTPSGEFMWLSPLYGQSVYNIIPVDISGNDETVYVSYYYFENSVYQLYMINSYNAVTGSNVLTQNFDYNVEGLYYDDFTGSVLISQNADELIMISGLNTSLVPSWSLQFGGTSAFGYVIGMGTDNYGYLYNYGYASNNLDYFGQIIEKGLFLAKQDVNGNIIWIDQFPGAFQDYTFGSYLVTDTITQNVYITGVFYEPFIIPGITTLTPADNGSIFILKYDFNGNYQWVVQEDFDGGSLCLSADYSGNILLSGTFADTIIIGSSVLNSAGGDDAFVSKYNSSGEYLWAIRAGGEGMEYIGLISTDQANNAYLTGEFASVDVTVDDFSITLEEGDGNILLAKLNSDGDVQWATSKAGSTILWADNYCWPTSIQADHNGNTYVKGLFRDSTYFDNILLTTPYINRFNHFIVKFDPNGNTIWANPILQKSPNGYTYGFDYNQMNIDQESNVYFGAQARDTTQFGNDFTYINQGTYDLYVAKYTSSGELDWVKAMESSTGYCWLSSVAVYNPESIYLGGFFNDYLNFGNSALLSDNQHGFLALIGEISGTKIYDKDASNCIFNLYPNPANDNVNILFKEEGLSDADILITDITGKNIYTEHLIQVNNSCEINLSGISAGVYFVKVQAGKLKEIKKLIIE